MLVCPNCKSEFEDGNTVCSECGTALVKQPEDEKEDTSDKWNWLKGFGNITAKRALAILFYLGLAPFFISSILFGKYIYVTNQYTKDILYSENGIQIHTGAVVNNLPLGVFLGVVYFIFGVLIWKIICELLIIIFRCFETYVEKNKRG